MPTKVKGRMVLADALLAMGKDYRADPVKAVRSQTFINHLHDYLADDLESRLTRWARKSRGVYVKKEAKLLGVAKDKNVDVAVIDPQNGPLLIIGARSQMSSIGNNIPGYFEGVIGDAMALQERFPMSTHGYVYLHPFTVIKSGKERQHHSVDKRRDRQIEFAVTGTAPAGDRSVHSGVACMVEFIVPKFSWHGREVHDQVRKSRIFTKNDFFL